MKYKPKKPTPPISISPFILIHSLSIILLYLLLFLITHFPSSLPLTPSITTLEHNTNIIKPLTDHREYEIVKLQNGITCILISDVTASRAGVSLNINVEGYYHDIAEFTQKILIRNTVKGQELKRLITKYYGTLKAFTENGISVYYYDIDNDGLIPSLNTLSDIVFNSTLKDDINRSSAGNNDIKSKAYYVELDLLTLKNTYDKENGNVNDDDIQHFPLLLVNNYLYNLTAKWDYHGLFDPLQGIINEIYTDVSKIKLSIISNYTLSDMKRIISASFGNTILKLTQHVNNKNYTTLTSDVHHNTLTLNKEFYFRKEQQDKHTYTFISLCTDKSLLPYYKYLSYILNTNDNDSLIQMLIAKQLAFDIQVEVVQPVLSSPFYFVIHAGINDVSQRNIDEITTYIISFFKQLSYTASFYTTYTDFKRIEQTKFDYITISKYHLYLSHITNALFACDSYHNVLYVQYNIPQYEYDKVLTCLSDVVKYNNIAIIVGSRTFAKEAYASGLRYKGVNYYLRNIDKDYMNNLIINKNNNEDNKFYFKQHNKYITKHTTIIHVVDDIVTSTYSSDNVNTVVDNRRITLYYKVDHTFKVPKTHMIMLFKYYDEISMKEYHSELTLTTVQTIQSYMFMYIKRYVLFKLHDAVLCGNDITFTFIRNLGFIIRVNAYSDVLHTIVSDILSYVTYLASTSPNVNDIRHIINNNNNVNDSDNVNDVVNDIINAYINIKVKSNIQPIHIHNGNDDTLCDMVVNAFKPYMRFVLYNLHISTLLYGNVSQKDAIDIKVLLERYNSNSNSNVNINPSPFYAYVNRYNSNWERSVNVTMLVENGFIDESVSTNIIGVRYISERELMNELMVDIMVEHWNEYSVNKAKLDKVIYDKLIFVVGCAPKVKQGGIIRGIVFKMEMGLYITELNEMKLQDAFDISKRKVAYIYKRKALSLQHKAERTWFKLYTGNSYYDDLETTSDISSVIDHISYTAFMKFVKEIFN